MVTYLRGLMFDENRFVFLARALIGGAAAYLTGHPEALGGLGATVGPILAALALGLGATPETPTKP